MIERKRENERMDKKMLKKILILENQFRAGMGSFIAKGFETAPGFEVSAMVVATDNYLEKATKFEADLILIDMDSLRRTDALVSALELRKTFPTIPVVFMSERENPVLTKEGLVAALFSNCYWLNKPTRSPQLVLAELEAAYHGKAQLDSSLLEEALTEANYQGLLSPQQHRVMRLMAAGMSNAAIGKACGISAKAVERTIAAASSLLDVEPASELTNRRVTAAMKYLRAMSFI